MQAIFRPLLIALAILIPASSQADRPRVTAPPMWASPQLHAEPLGHGIIRIFGAKFNDDVQAFWQARDDGQAGQGGSDAAASIAEASFLVHRFSSSPVGPNRLPWSS